ncbi:MAG TPA: hypothetical protein DCZ43_03380, partial [candidate division Zixibacteria bacterium]|nr:hypothetical protein [candidate division Zixibacteria bacterium]
MKRIAVISIIMMLMALGGAKAQNIEYVGSALWSGINDVKVAGNYAYCAFFNGLVILDITNPSSPNLVSQYYIGGDCSYPNITTGQKLSVSENYVYFTADFMGLQIIDISNPLNPHFAGEFITPTYARGIDVQGMYAYLTSIRTNQQPFSQIQILDISNPSNPILIGSCHTPGGARNIAVSGGYAYIADESAGLQIIDINDPSNPYILGNYDRDMTAMGDVAISGGYAYLASSSGLFIVNISNPNHPTLAGSFTEYGVGSVSIAGD